MPTITINERKRKKSTTSNLKKLFAQFQREVQLSGLNKRFYKAPVAAVLTGSPTMIEAVVREASSDSGIDMDWHFVGGRAAIRTLGDVKKSRSALYCAIPQSDLTLNDL